jgi:chromosome partitioning protein
MSLPPTPRVLALANQKGGVGKTTTAINLGTALAAIGEDVLIVDLDPQGNASTGLGIDRKSRERSTYDLLLGEATVLDVALQTSVPRVSVAPSTLDLLGVELEIAGWTDRAYRLRKALADPELSRMRNYSYVLVDCPPSLNLLTINAMAASHSVLVPLQCEFFALEGLSQLLLLSDTVLQRGAKGLFPKGRDFEREISVASQSWDFDLVIHKSRIEPEAAILEVSNLVRKPVRQAAKP